MAVFFFAIVGAIAVTGLLVYDMDRKRRSMGEILARLEPLAEGSKKFRAQHLRRLSLSIFFNSQLMDSLEREIGLMEGEREISAPDEGSGGLFSSSKRLQALAARIDTLEMLKLVKEREKEESKSEPPPAERAAEEVDEGVENDAGGQDSQATA